ncbi:chromosome partitioning protein ParA (plasmid) [Deinococcus aetherius]|uniref:Chromosome partitioning protein ParA n=1 Tax=Deinococcus aetherius TaxID=200252 RepID=A0ABM8AK81_9DEIO|nr:ParA family protein [Deinococcus aetherius]BDP44234.1 chromosome partitioning protein ParA [Deinococcus aetherius]
MRAITFFNHAGGAAKTSTALNVGYTLGAAGYRVLLIDADPQANLTRWLGAEVPGGPDAKFETLYSAVLGPTEDLSLPQPVRVHGLDLVRSCLDLAEVEPLLPGQVMGQMRLRTAVRHLASAYDFVLIDPPPSLGQLSTLAVLAADDLVVPVPAGNKGLEGLTGVTRMVATFRQVAVPSLRIALMVPTRVGNTNLSRESVEALRAAGVAPVSTPLTERPSVYPNSQLQGLPIALYDPRNPAVAEVQAVTRELLEVLGEVPHAQARP